MCSFATPTNNKSIIVVPAHTLIQIYHYCPALGILAISVLFCFGWGLVFLACVFNDRKIWLISASSRTETTPHGFRHSFFVLNYIAP